MCFREWRVPLDWRSACVVPLYNGKGDKYECSCFRGISLPRLVGKVYGGVLNEKKRRGTERMVSVLVKVEATWIRFVR